MPKKVSKFVIKGMQRDLSVSKFNPEFAFENKNLRIAALGDNTLLSLVNEKGTSLCEIIWVTSPDGDTGETDSFVYGIPIGKAVIDRKLILFTHKINDTTDYPDRIYKLWFDDDMLKGMVLKRGNLGFLETNPIETLTSYESESVQKVYWVDGVNQPRVLNVVGEHTQTAKVDFLPTFSRTLQADIERQHNGAGIFNSGTVQYVVTYYEKYGQETNAVYVSPIYYISPTDRGGSPDETNTCSFILNFTGIDTSYQYLRIYSLQKSSENGSPLAHIVADIKISGSSFSYTDTGTYNQTIDPTILMYLGGVEITASTLTQKDNTLFLGDLTLTGDAFTETQISNIKTYFESKRSSDGTMADSSILYFSTKTVDYPTGNDVYLYRNQLNDSSEEITTFKSGEYYRFGVQFMTAKGQWSQVFYVGDLKNTIYPIVNISGTVTLAKAAFRMDSELYGYLGSNIVSYRLVYAEMTLADHTVLAQGVVCPTVFNYKQRVKKQPYALSSWFMRPDNDPNFNNWHLYNIQDKEINTSSEIQGFDPDSDEYRIDSKVSENERGVVCQAQIDITVERWKTWLYRLSRGTVVVRLLDKSGNTVYTDEYKTNSTSHYKVFSKIKSYLIGALTYQGVQIISDDDLTSSDSTQSYNWGNFLNWFVEDSSYTSTKTLPYSIDGQTFATEKNAANYFVDRSLVTFHSPELESMRDRINNSSIKFRLVGLASITANASQYDISVKNNTGLLSEGANLQVYSFDHNNMSSDTSGLKAFPLWCDGKWESQDDDGNFTCSGATTLYPIYPWHASGSLNGHPDKTGSQEYTDKSSVLEKKVLANLRFSNLTKYVGNSSISSIYNMDISSPQIVDSDNVTINKVYDSRLGNLTYYGNYDHLLLHTSKYPVYNIGSASGITSKEVAEDGMNNIDLTSKVPETFGSIRIKFKSTMHAVMKFQNVDEHTDLILPYGEDVPPSDGVAGSTVRYTQLPWDRSRNNYSFYDKVLQTSGWLSTQLYPFLWVGEYYIDRPDSWLGGTDDNAIESDKWIPAGDPVAVGSATYAYGTKGDTYFQRWDCLKTYPYTENDENSVIDVTSFMVESYTNLDGRYDKNRGTTNLLYNRPSNFNLMNRAYTQKDNVFNYSVLDEKFNLNVYKNQITWSKTKTPSEDVDTWTNITLASVLDLDGDRGKITKLARLNNSLLCFQESGISEIQFNNITAISTKEGVPLEIANSGKVNGKNYISSTIGCTNKWSICEGSGGLYFMDDLRRKIMRLSNKGLESLSDTLGFSSWAYDNISGAYDSWLPADATDFTAQYDNNTSDVYFINKDTCLAYNENLGQFTSFYSYQGTLFMANLDDKCIAIAPNRDNQQTGNSVYKMWRMHNGEYNNFFGAYDDFYTTVIANQDVESDKIFDTLEFRSDTWNSSGELLPHRTFDTLVTWNEYQRGTSNLSFVLGRPSNLKHKFRIWRANIPRSDTNKMDRMRNPWLYIKLAMENPNTNKTVLHDMLVYYFL